MRDVCGFGNLDSLRLVPSVGGARRAPSQSAFVSFVPLFVLLLGFLGAQIPQKSHAGMTFQGRVVQSNGQPLEANLVSFTFEVRSPAPEDCLLFREVHTLNMNNSKGLFSLVLGTGAPTGPAISLLQAFSPVGSYTGLTCGDGSTAWNSDPTDPRTLTVTVFDGLTTITIADDSTVEEVPYAMHASTLGGIDKDGFIKVNASGTSLTQANVEQVFSTTNFPELVALLNGTSTRYAKSADLPVSGGILNMTGGGVRVPDTPPTNDSAVNKNYSDGYIAGRRIDGTNLTGLTNGESLRWDSTANSGAGGWVRYTPVSAGAVVNSVVGAGPIAVTGTTNVTVDLDYGNGLMVSGGTLQARPGTGILVDGTGIRADIGTASGQVMGAGAVPSCLANEKLQMSAGPTFVWSCVADQTGTSSQWATSGSDIYYNAGNVGIGTVPSTFFDVRSTALNYWPFSFSSNNTYYFTLGGGAGAYPNLQFTGNNGASAQMIGLNATGDLNFIPGTNVFNTPTMTVKWGGNVGIGQTNPATSLDVNGAVRVGTTATVCAAPVAGAIRYNSGVMEFCNGTAWTTFTTGSSLPAAAGSAGTPGYAFIGDTNTGMFAAAADQIGFSTNGAERVRIDNNGRLGIGVTSLSEMLEVNGAIRIGNSAGAGGNAGTIRWDGTSFQGYTGTSWVNLSGAAAPGTTNCDTTQTFATAGTYTYNVPASFGTITIRLWGGGGAGGSLGSAGSPGPSGSGGPSSIVSLGLVAGGGVGGGGAGPSSAGAGGAGGTASGGIVTAPGSAGESGISGTRSGAGGAATNGGTAGGSLTTSGVGIAGQAPGGGGGGAYSAGISAAGGGGGGGGYVERTYTAATLIPGTNINDIIVGGGGIATSTATGTGGSGGAGRVTIACASAGTPPANDRALVFMDGANYSNNTNLVYSSDGNLGVGTGTPQARLDVNGGVKVGATAAACSAALEGTFRWNSADKVAEVCNGTSWTRLAAASGTGVQSTPPVTSGYFVVTSGSWNGNLGGFDGADAKCLTDLTANDWNGKADAVSRGLLTSAKVKAWLCHGSCQLGVAGVMYYFAASGNASMGGATMTTDASGTGPGNTQNWSGTNYFGGYEEYWTGRSGVDTATSFATGIADGSFYNNCAGWTDVGTSGRIGISASTGVERFNFNGASCGSTKKLVCWVHP